MMQAIKAAQLGEDTQVGILFNEITKELNNNYIVD